MGFFDKLKQGLKKTHENIFSKVDRLINAKSKIDDEFIDNLEEILLSSDVGVVTTEQIIENLRNRVKEEKYADTSELNNILKSEIQNVLASSNGQLSEPFKVTSKP